MKRFFALAGSISLLAVFWFGPPAGAESLDVSGKSFDVLMLCTDDAGDYCDDFELVADEFIFEDETFEIGSFSEELFGFGGSGEYEMNGIFFQAEYEAIDDAFEKYEIDIRGIAPLENMILGIAELKYFEWDIIDFDEEDEAQAYFIGFKK